MGKFILGLIIGIVVGAVAVTMNPNLGEELRVSLANLTAQLMRSAGETAEDLGNAAKNAAGRREQPADTGPPPATSPGTPAEPGQTRQPD